MNDVPNAQRAVWRNGGSSPQTILWKIARYYPAASSVEAPPASSRWDVVRHVGTAQPEIVKNENNDKIV